MSDSEIVEVLRSHSAWDLAKAYYFNIHLFCNRLLKVLDLGVLPAKIFVLLYEHPGEWSTAEISRTLREDHSYVFRSLKRLERHGFVERVSRQKWTIRP